MIVHLTRRIANYVILTAVASSLAYVLASITLNPATKYESKHPRPSQATIDGWLKSNATANVITGNPGGTPNRLLYKAGL